MKVGFVDVAGINTRILYEGDESNPPLVLLHGYGGTGDLWIRNIDVLADEFFVVAPDMIGCGFTDKPSFEGKPPQRPAVEHLCGLVEALGLEGLAIGGSSYGALIAALVFLAIPARVEKLIINGSGSAFNTDSELIAALERVHGIFKPLVSAPSLAGIRGVMEKQCYDPKSVPDEILPVTLTAFSLPGFAQVWEEGILGLMDLDKTANYRILHRLEALTVPTLVPWGLDDVGASYDSAVEAVARMPNATMVAFEQCGHKPMFEHEHKYNQLLREFLKS